MQHRPRVEQAVLRRTELTPDSVTDTRAARKPTDKVKPAPRAPKPKKQRAPGMPLPKGTWWLTRYGFQRAFSNSQVIVPRYGANQLADIEIAYLEDRIRVFAHRMQLTISFANVKGGASKSTTAAYIGCILAELTRKNVFLLPATSATATSTTAMYAGVKPEHTLTVSQFADMYQRYPDYRKLSAAVPRNKFGLAVISEDQTEGLSIQAPFDNAKFVPMVETLRPSADIMLFDTGNDVVREDSVPLEAVRRSDIVVFTATADKKVTLEKVRSTIAPYLTDLKNDKNRDRSNDTVRSEWEIPTREKVSQSIVAISGTKRRQAAEDFEQYTRSESGNAIGFEGRVMVVPQDLYMAKHIEADINKINRRHTYLAYLRLIDAIFTSAAQLRGVPLDETGNAPVS